MRSSVRRGDRGSFAQRVDDVGHGVVAGPDASRRQGLEIARRHRAKKTSAKLWVVPSQSHAGAYGKRTRKSPGEPVWLPRGSSFAAQGNRGGRMGG